MSDFIDSIFIKHGVICGIGRSNAPIFLFGDDPPDEMLIVPPTASAASQSGTAYPTGYVYGLNLVDPTGGGSVSTTTVTVQPGNCRDAADAANMVLSSAVTIDVTQHEVIQGNVRKQLSGTSASTNLSPTIAGTSSHYLTDFGTRALSAGTVTTVGTAATGTGTKFLSDLAIGDLLGTAANGYSQVTAIASDTACTLAVAIPGGNLTGAACNVIENALFYFKDAGGSVVGGSVQKITSDTSLTLTSNATFTLSGETAFAGDLTATQTILNGKAIGHVWLVSGGSGTGAIISSQRTTPWLPTGYTTSYRRLGGLTLIGNSGALAWTQVGKGPERTLTYQIGGSLYDSRLLLNGNSSGAWSAPTNQANIICPSTAVSLSLTVQVAPTGSTQAGEVRPRNAGDSTANRNSAGFAVAGGLTTIVLQCDCDGAQGIEYATSGATTNCSIWVNGFKEML